ncbi:MAG: hypothetical protein SVT52_07620 [Planctomycetota bacterium]|nr:hypothetical protein [Planctomycetota bacterium]
MALQHGKKADQPAIRWAGFTLLTGLGLATLAAVALLPPYARLAGSEYELAKLRAALADAEALAAANQRLIDALPEDEVLTKRLMMRQGDKLPKDEVVVFDPAAPSPPSPGAVPPARRSRPDPPSAWLLAVADRLENTATRRGLFMLAVGAIAAAMILFAAPASSKPSAGKSNEV